MSLNHVQEKLKSLFDAYAKNLPSKIAKIEHQWKDLLANWDKTQFQNFHREVHTLCGSAGTYGYIALSKSARQLEIYIKSLLDYSTLSLEQKNEVTTLLENIKATLSARETVDFPVSELPIMPTTLNNFVYIIDNDEHFQEKINSIKESGYIFSVIDIKQLANEVKKNKPVAVIVNIDFIDDDNIRSIQEIKEQQTSPFRLFCISTQGDILTRLKAIRMGNDVFLQKPLDEFQFKKILDQFCGVTTEDPYRILIVDDSLSLAEYFSLILQEVGMITHFITNPLMIIDAIEEFQPDILLMDIYMPECTGLELAAVLRQEAKYTRLPIIFLSTEGDRLKQLTALNLGGDDFLTKPILPKHLIEAVKSRAKRAGILSSMMMRDSLTGLFNHTTILQRLEVEIARAERFAEPLCFVMIDIDYFKSINDKYGHPVGDRVIKSLSNLLATSLRKTDITGRYGGEEFAIILPNTDSENGFKICRDLRDKFSQIVYKLNSTSFHATFSAGISTFPQIKEANNLVVAADKALYEAKLSGRNQVK